VGRGDYVAAAIEIHDRRFAVPRERCGPQTIYGVGLFVSHTLRLGAHVFGVLSCLSLMGNYCALLDLPLSGADLRTDCPEHEPAA
jgi:hypothetical protein